MSRKTIFCSQLQGMPWGSRALKLLIYFPLCSGGSLQSWAALGSCVCEGMELSAKCTVLLLCCLPSSLINEQEQLGDHPHLHHV